MKSVLLLLLLSFFTSVIWAQNVEQSKLWPDKQNANEAEIYIYTTPQKVIKVYLLY